MDIVRYDCLDGCGFNYSYATLDAAVRAQNATHTDLFSIGGECTNSSTVETLCECAAHDFFVGDTCRESCPGLIGPVVRDHARDAFYSNTSMVTVGDYAFYVCSGHGTCDIEYRRCECELGFGGDACEVVYEEFTYDMRLKIMFTVLYGLFIAVLLFSIFWVHTNRHLREIRALAPNITILFTCGAILVSIGTVLYLFHPLTDVLCNVRQYIYGIGGAPMFYLVSC